jgi:amino-acid N-acetyltransferase
MIVSDEGSVTFRMAAPGDLPAIERLLVANDLILEGVRESIADFIVAEEGSELVGVVGLEVRAPYALLRSAAVAPTRHRAGIGARLVARVVELAEARDLVELYLFTPSAAPFFARHGFRTTSRDAIPAELRETGQFTHACGATAVTMVRRLSE